MASPLIVVWANTPDALPYIQTLCLLFPILLLTGISRGQLTAEQKFAYLAKSNSFASTIATGVALILAFQGFGAWSLVVQHLLASVLTLALLIKPLHARIYWQWDHQLLLHVMPYYYKSAVYNSIIWIGSQAPIVMSAKLFNASASGIYSMTQRVSSLPREVLGQGFLMSFFSSVAEQDTNIRSQQANLYWAIKVNVLVLSSLYLFATISAQELVTIILGEKFAPHWSLFSTLCLGMAFVSTTGGFVGYLKGTGRVNTMMFLSFLRTTAVCLLIYLFWHSNKQLSSIAEAVTYSNVFITACYFFMMFGSLKFQVSDFIKQVCPIILAVCFTAISTYLVKTQLTETIRMSLWTSLTVTSVTYPTLLLLFCSVFSFSETKQILNKVHTKLAR